MKIFGITFGKNKAEAKQTTVQLYPRFKLQTNQGELVVELDRVKAPISVANFENYVKSGFYNSTVFHRVIKGFMIQGGGLTSGLVVKYPQNAPIQNESNNGLKNLKYTISMARMNSLNSATSQFFINTADNFSLDAKGGVASGYAVFGKVISGFDVVDTIEIVPTDESNGYDDAPTREVVILNVTPV